MSGSRSRFCSRAVAAIVVASIMLSLIPCQVFAQEGKKVGQVVISGNKNINKETVYNVVKLKPGDTYTKDAVEKDRTAINDIGYFSAVSVKTEDTPEGVNVTYDVVENPVIVDIKLVGEGPICAATVKALLRTQAGQVLNTKTLNIDIEAIQRRYRDDGYVAYVTEDIGIDRETGILTIPILVHTVQSIKIVGNKKTKEKVFLREMRTQPGSVFNMKLLREDISRVYNLDILEDVQTPKIEPGVDPGKLVISVPVTEKKTGSVSLGLGYSSQSRLVGRAELAETNLRGTGRGLTALFETGTSDSRLGGKYSYELGYTEPWIDRKHTSLSMSVYNKLLYRFSSSFIGGNSEVNGQTYNERHRGGDVGISRPFSQYTRGFLNIKAENVQTTDLTSTTGSNLVAQDGDIRSGTFRLTRNTRDFDKDPAIGQYRTASLQLGQADVMQSIPGSGSTPTTILSPLKGPFEKLQFDFRRYWSRGGRKISPNDKRSTIAARLLFGASNGQMPFFEQYFVGGAETLRGYKEDRFWGNEMAVASLEYRKPIANALTGVVFVDYGDAWGGSSLYDNVSGFTQHSGFVGNLGTGVGIRVNTPIGNLRLDYGIGSEGGRTHFSIGQAY